MTDNLYILLGQGLLTLLSCWISFKYGRSVEKNERNKQEAQASAVADDLRADLSDPDVRRRLHAEFKR